MSSKLEYSRRLYDDVLDWYKSADSKAQVVLAIDTAFLAFLTSTIFSEPDKLRAILAVFSWVTWLNLTLMLLSLIVSIGSAIFCVWSRIYSLKEVKQIIKKAESRCQDPDNPDFSPRFSKLAYKPCQISFSGEGQKKQSVILPNQPRIQWGLGLSGFSRDL